MTQPTLHDPPGDGGRRPATYDVFISYAREDSRKVELLADALREQGLRVWTDNEIALGESWRQRIDSALQGSRAVLAVTSLASERSAYVSNEISAAVAMRVADPEKLIIPILIGSRTKSPPLLQDLQGITVGSDEDIKEAALVIARQLASSTKVTREVSEALEVVALHSAALDFEREKYLLTLAISKTKRAWGFTLFGTIFFLGIAVFAIATTVVFAHRSHVLEISLNIAFAVLNIVGTAYGVATFRRERHKDRT